MTRKISGQAPLEGFEKSAEFDLHSQQTFGHIAQPEYWGIKPWEYVDITQDFQARIKPDGIRPFLIDVPHNSPCAVGYKDAFSPRQTYVAVTPFEYGIVARSVDALGRASINKTRASTLPSRDYDDSQDAALRSGVYTIDNYISRMESYTTNSLEQDHQRLLRFREYVDNPHFRRLKGDNMRVELEWLRTHIFGDILEALSTQKSWSADQKELAQRTLDYNLFLDRGNNQHLRNWAEMLAFAAEYSRHKWALFKSKTHEAKTWRRSRIQD